MASLPVEGIGAVAPAGATPPPAVVDSSPAAEVADLFEASYARLVHLARHLLDDPSAAEDVVMDAFASLAAHWRRLNDRTAAHGYLRACVVNGARTRTRRRIVARRHLGVGALSATDVAADDAVLARLDQVALASAVRGLPERQRHVLVLRYYEELNVAETADLLGCSTATVKTHTARALRTLAARLGGER
ncbi:MAG: sigma-70 family RNA polymerase sigma factor [Sporichthyaceae bacterium]